MVSLSLLFRIFSSASVFITWLLIPYGALVRLKGAGLACPDWPLCYGEIIPPFGVEIFFEVSHRFVATLLGILIIALCSLSFCSDFSRKLKYYCFSALVLVITQGIFGALTVTMALSPIIVIFHLIGGILLFWLLIFIFMYAKIPKNGRKTRQFAGEFSSGGLWTMNIVLFVILISGGFNSANYAGYVCDAFPLCQSSDPWTFSWNSTDGFTTKNHSEAVDIEGKVIPANSLEWIHMIHRILAILGGSILLFLAFFSIQTGGEKRRIAVRRLLVGGILTEFFVGILNAIWRIPVPISAFHTFIAAGLVGTIAYATALKITTIEKS